MYASEIITEIFKKKCHFDYDGRHMANPAIYDGTYAECLEAMRMLVGPDRRRGTIILNCPRCGIVHTTVELSSGGAMIRVRPEEPK